ncbi:2-oxoacid:acceptor oxidoreductase family protein [Chloroflexota bacterium]
MSRTEVRIAGFGGQGVVLAGMVLGTAAVVYDGKKAVQTQSYGAETRGGAARSEVILGDSEIIYPQVRRPDILVALSTPALEKFIGDLKPGGILIVDQDLVTVEDATAHRVYRAPFSDIAVREMGRGLVANAVMLGFLTGVTGIVSREAMEQAIKDTAPSGAEELNLKAFRKGLEIASAGDQRR